MPISRCLPLLLCNALLLATALPSCTSVPESQARTDGQTILQARKEASLTRWNRRVVENTNFSDYTNSRIALLVGGQAHLKINKIAVNRQHGVSRTNLTIKGSNLDFGTATAISKDGYYLTSAHCVTMQPLMLLAADLNGLRKAPARIVWSGKSDTPSLPDIAIIHSPLKAPNSLILAPLDTIRPRIPVFASGFGGIALPQAKPHQAGPRKINHSGGRALKVIHRQNSSGLHWIEFQHNAPLLTGDSGGPVIDEEGRLLGITSTVEFFLHKFLGMERLRSYASTAIQLDPAWLATQVQRDRDKRGVNLPSAAIP